MTNEMKTKGWNIMINGSLEMIADVKKLRTLAFGKLETATTKNEINYYNKAITRYDRQIENENITINQLVRAIENLK